MQELKSLLLSYLQKIGIKADFKLVLKEYSKSLYGRYNPNTKTIFLYVFADSTLSTSYSVWDLLKTTIHEACHFEQWSDPSFVRHKGVMHNTDFWGRYNKYVALADELLTNQEKGVCYINEKIAL